MSGASSVGHVLLTPQLLVRASAADGEQALLDDLLATFARVAADAAQGGTIAEDLTAACEALMRRLLSRAGSGVHHAVSRLEDLVRPLTSAAGSLSELLDHDDPADVASGLLALLKTLAGTASALTVEAVRVRVTTVLDILEHDLGLTAAALEAELWTFASDVIDRLEAPRDGLDASSVANRIAVAGTLRGVRRRSLGTFRFPTLRADEIAQMLFVELGALIGPVLEKVACVGHVSEDVVTALNAVKAAVPYTGLDSRTLGAGGADPANTSEYLWYASWLLGDDVWIDHMEGGGERVMLVDHQLVLRSGAADVLPFGDDAASWAGLMVPTSDALEAAAQGGPIPTTWDRRYTFDLVSPATMERYAYHSAWIAEAVETLSHIWYPVDGLTSKSLKIKKGNAPSATDVMDALYGGFQLAIKASEKRPVAFAIKPGTAGRLAGLAPTLLFHGVGSLQGMHWNAKGIDEFKMWGAVLIPSDALNFLTPNLILGVARDALLSTLTSLNDDDKDGAPDNLRHNGGIIGLVQAVMNAILTRVIFPKKYYGHPTTGNSTQVPNWSVTVWLEYELLLCTLWGVLSWFLGNCTACACAHRFTAPPGTPKDIALTVLKSVGLFYVNLFSAVEGKTEDGKLNLEGGAEFKGYQDSDASPYLLPWAADKTWICGQGNLGLFSHNFTNPLAPQVYAYDFMLDMGTEVLAARPGVVVDYFDWVPDGTGDNTPGDTTLLRSGQTTSDTWNFVAIRHDPDPQDLGPGGAAVTTYGVYGHGLQGSVRKVFSEHTPGVAAMGIIGTPVARGEPIMLADSTGVSLCNHVHFEVRVGPGAAVAPPIDRSRFTITIPFVFKDGGRPSTLEWLVSSNERVPAS